MNVQLVGLTQKTVKVSHPRFHLLPCHITPLCCGSTVTTVPPLPALISILTFVNWIQVSEANYSHNTPPVKMLLTTRPLTDLVDHRLSVFIWRCCVPLMLNRCWSQLIREISLICPVLVNQCTWRKTEVCKTVVPNQSIAMDRSISGRSVFFSKSKCIIITCGGHVWSAAMRVWLYPGKVIFKTLYKRFKTDFPWNSAEKLKRQLVSFH